MILLLLLTTTIYSAIIRPSSNSPIRLSLSNRFLYSDYTFTMNPETAIPQKGLIEIIFPPTYLSGLGIDLILDSTCSHPCTIDTRTVLFTLPTGAPASSELQVTIRQVKNPEEKGATGNFQVRTKLGQNVFDENLIFGNVGIGDYAIDFNAMIVEIDETTTNVVGQQALYNFYMKAPLKLPAGFYMQITAPLQTDLKTCKVIPYDGVKLDYEVTCTADPTLTNAILITGFKTIEALFTFGLQINFQNPTFSQTTGTFRVIAFRKGTTFVYSWRSAVAGMEIIPGKLQEASLVAEIDKTGQLSNYKLKFTTFNKVPADGSIAVVLPKHYELAYKTNYDKIEVISGIASDVLQVTYDLYSFTISKFQEIAANQDIEIHFRAYNPQIGGKSAPFLVQSQLNGKVIDEIKTLTHTAVDASFILPVSATVSVPQSKAVTSLSFSLVPTKLTGKSIEIDFKAFFKVTGTLTSASCLVQASPSQGCSSADNKVIVIASSAITTTTTIQLLNILQNADLPSQGLLYYRTIDASGIDVDFGTIKFGQLPEKDTTATFNLLGRELSTTSNKKYSTLSIQFKVINAIPDNIIIREVVDVDPGTGDADPAPADPDAPETPVKPTPPDPHGELWVEFGPLLTWDYSLGMTAVYCLTNLVPLTNMVIKCTLSVGTQSTYPEIRIHNFKAIAANTVVTVKIPSILNPQVSPAEFTIYAGYRQYSSRVPTSYATASIVLSTAGPATWNTLTSLYTISSSSVNTAFSCQFTPGFSALVPTGSTIRIQLPTYDIGFLQPTTTCQIDSVVHPCTLYPGLDWVEIQVASNVLTTAKITLLNLKWPPTSTSAGDLRWIAFVSNNEQEKAILQQVGNINFPAPAPNDFVAASALVYETRRGYAGGLYEFEFSLPNLAPDGSQMKITFPADFATKFSSPAPTCNGSPITAIPLGQIEANKPFSVKCQGLKTPASPPDSICDGFDVQIFYQSRLLNQRLNFFSFTYGELFVAGTIQILDLVATPSNVLELAFYSILFQPVNPLLEQAVLRITFPSENFPELPYPPGLADCSLTGSLNSFETCSLEGSAFKIVLNTKYYSGSVLFTINNVQNPNVSVSQGFSIQSFYDGTLIDQTDLSTLLNRTIAFYPQASPLLVNSIDFAPRNRGVKAIYDFNLTLSQELTAFQQLVITFPLAFDQRLGDNLKALLNGVRVDIQVVKRQLFITKANYGTKIILSVQNVQNPTITSNTEEFRVGITSNSQYVYYNSSTGVLEFLQSPGWLYLEDIVISNHFARWQAQYNFTLTLSNKIPLNGYLQLDFPSQYEISDSTPQCNFPSCSLSSNVLKAKQDPINGNITLWVFVENPLSETTVSDYVIKSQDAKQIVEQSYPNLDPFSYQYTYSGPLIYINNDQDVIAYQGAETPDIYFRVVYPQALNLTFKHVETGPFKVVPKEIYFDYTQLETSFRVQIPQDLPQGLYYIYWTTIGEKSPPFYTPVKRTQVIVRPSQLDISVSSLFQIPIGGESLPITVSVPNAPNHGLIVTTSSNDKVIYLESEQIGSSINLTFTNGVNKQTFRVKQNYTELRRQQQLGILSEEERLISFALSNPLYKKLPNLTITFQEAMLLPPEVVTFEYAEIQRTTARIKIITNQIVEAYFSYRLNRSEAPLISELLNQGPPLHVTTLSKYGYQLIVREGELVLEVHAQVQYSFFMVLRNQGGLYSKIFNSSFLTQARNPLAEFTLNTNFLMTDAEQLNSMKSIAFILSLPTWKVQRKIEYATPKSGRLLQTNQLQLQIIPFNETDIYPSPNELINKLIRELSLYGATYLKGMSISGSRLSSSPIPELQSPSVKATYLYDCEIQATLSVQGMIFAIASGKTASTPYQIFRGLDHLNRAVPSANHRVLDLKEQVFNISNLEPNSSYTVYLLSANDFPEYPDLAEQISTLECQTLTLPERAPLIVSRGEFLGVLALIIILIV